MRRSHAREPLVIDALRPSPRPESSRPCVVHLVRAANGPAPFRAFLDALRDFPPGANCELVLAMKGFSSPRDAEPYLEQARDLGAETMFFPDTGFDLGVYLAAAARLRRERYCFLNSYSEPLSEGWLAKLDAALQLADVGIVSGSGSWNSSRSWVLHSLGLPSAYRHLLPARRSIREQFAQMDAERPTAEPELPAGGGAGDGRSSKAATARAATRVPSVALRALSEIPRQMRDFESFPAHHLRTNAFMIAHSTLAGLRLHQIREKADAYALESGRTGLTRQVQRMGLRAVVVDRAGRAHDQDGWHLSRTFWQGSQEGLLVADNQTRMYERGGADRRRLLSALAWGPCADPSPTPEGERG